MPTYEYACGKCGRHVDVFQYMTDKPLRKCPTCGKSALKRLIGTGAAVIFKGSGFYETDYKRKSGGGGGGSCPSGDSAPKPSEDKKPI